MRYHSYGCGLDQPQQEYPGWVMGPNGHWIPADPLTMQGQQGSQVGFGGGFTPGQLAVTGIASYAVTRFLGASVPGAIVMGIGNILWEAGSPGIPAGWKRYVLGLFRKPHE